MGISQFAALLHILFPSSISIFDWSQNSSVYEHVLLDLNGLLYTLRLANQDDAALILAVLKYIDKLIQVLPPQTTLFLALDGSRTRSQFQPA
jgi:5'-3' exonuclease